MIEGRKTPREQAPEIEEILSSAQLIVFYGKDIPAFLKKSGITLPQAKTLDLAHEFSEAHGAYGPGNRLLEGPARLKSASPISAARHQRRQLLQRQRLRLSPSTNCYAIPGTENRAQSRSRA